MSQTRMAAVPAGSGSQPRLEAQDHASQVPARLFRNGHAHRAMRVKFPARFSNRLALSTPGTHTRRQPPRTQLALGNAADQLAMSCLINHRLHSRELSDASLQRRIVSSSFTICATTL